MGFKTRVYDSHFSKSKILMAVKDIDLIRGIGRGRGYDWNQPQTHPKFIITEYYWVISLYV